MLTDTSDLTPWNLATVGLAVYVRFPESGHSECRYPDRAERLLMAVSRHSELTGDAQSGQISRDFGPYTGLN